MSPQAQFPNTDPGELFLTEQRTGRVGTVVDALDLIPSPIFPDLGVLRAAPQARVGDDESEVAVRHLPRAPFFRVGERIDLLRASDEVVHDLSQTGVTLFGGDQANRVPAVFAGPGVSQRNVKKIVRSYDLAPTWARWLPLVNARF